MKTSTTVLQPGLVLLAEDDENDVFFLRRAFEQARLPIAIIDVPNGEEAIKYLSGQMPYCDRNRYPLPHLLLLDLKMPLMNGFEVLAWLKDRFDFSTLPVVVLSSSGFDADIKRALQLGARDYFVKPETPDHLVEIVRGLNARWLHEIAIAC